MKKIILAAFLAAMLSNSAFAFTITDVDAEDIFSPELAEEETISDWARDGILRADQLGLIPDLTDRPAYQSPKEVFSGILYSNCLFTNIFCRDS